MDEVLQQFVDGLKPCTTLLSVGKATVDGNVVDAVKVRNLYGQEIVWGKFNRGKKHKYEGKRLTNDAATEGVEYESGGAGTFLSGAASQSG